MKKSCLNRITKRSYRPIEVCCHKLTCSSTSWFVCFLLGIACLANGEEKSLAELMPRIPPKTVEEARQSFKLQHGFGLELVASEPHVVDPIDAAFDEQGRMYVVEMNDYPFLPEQRVQKYRDQRSETWGRIRLLTDTDQDGRMDKSVIFADRLRWPQSVICYRGGVFVISPPHLYFMKDTDGDGVADVREVVCSGFNTTNVQALANGLEWGRDNAIYFSSGIAGGELTVAAQGNIPEYKLTPGRRDLRLDPATRRLTMVAGGQQFGHTIDDFGERFVCSNSNHIVHATWPLNYLERNPLLVIPDVTRSIGKEGAAAIVFRASTAEPWRLVRTARRAADPEMRKKLPPNELVPIGFFTSATGITVYRGGAYPADFRGNVFIGDCGGNLVHRKRLTANGISYVAERADRDVEFLTSTDNWFRPVNFVNAPDGTLYVIDMYRETIEHPASIPDDIKALVDLESGYDKGRIWRLVPPNYRRTTPPNLDQASTQELVSSLSSPHGWVRDTAQRLLVERNDQSAVEPLRSLVRYGTDQTNAMSSPQTQIHALWTLYGLQALQSGDLQAALSSSDEHVCEHGLRLLPELADQFADLNTLLTPLSQNPSARVSWQLAFTMGELPARFAIPGLKELAKRAADDSDLRTAWLSSGHSQMGGLAAELMKGELETVKPLLKDLAKLIGSAADPTDSIQLLESVVRHGDSDATRIAILNELGEGLRRRGTTIVRILVDKKMNSDVTESLMKLFQRTSTVALNNEAQETDRISAIRLLAQGDAEMAERTLSELLTPQASPDLQQAAVKSLAAHGTANAIKAMLDSWKGCGPATRREIVDSLVQSSSGAKALLAAIENASIKPGEIERDKRQLLMNHPQVSVRNAAKRVLAEPPSNRKQVVADYQPALELTGDAARGRMLYGKTCIQCHRAGKEGHQVGPDFASVQNKSTADLLVAILDPNREAQPNFQTYTAVTKQGKVHTGIISAETAASLTLKRAEAKEDVVLRETLDELVSNGVSLMPEGMEKDLNQQQLADLIAMIKSGQ